MIGSLLAVSSATAVIVWLFWNNFKSPKHRLPPGPKGAFIVGHAFRDWFNSDYFNEVSKTYGEIFVLPVMGFKIIVLSGYEVTKEAFTHDWLTGRVITPYMKDFTQNGLGLLWSEGPLFRVHRRFTLTVLRDFGFGKSKIEVTIKDELQHLRQALRSENGRSFHPQQAVAKAVSNVINSIVLNERCSEDAEFETIVEVVKSVTSVNPRVALFSVLWPVVKHLPLDFGGLKRLNSDRQKIFDYLGKKYQHHKETFDPANIRDYIDAFLFESRNSVKEDSVFFTEQQLLQAIFDLFNAGMETTTTNLLWAMVYLAKNPEIQRKVFDEINQAIGDTKLPETSDRVNLRYTDAFVHEVMRYTTVIPFSIPRRAIESGQIRGYDIPKNSVVISDLISANRNEKWWKDPYNFNPNNFLDDKGTLVNSNCLLSFGSGKRACLGESLAKQELFIFVTGLVQQFEFIADSLHPLPDVEQCKKNVIFRVPPPFQIIARPRFTEQ